MTELDVSELRKLEADLSAVAGKVNKDLRPVLQRGALNVKRDAQRLASGLAHAPHYPKAITYETRDKASGPTAVVGPDKGKRQGALGNILEYGTSKNPPHPHLGPALKAEEPRFVKAVSDLLKDVL